MLQLINLAVGYSQKILNELDIHIHEGEIKVILGLNGSGKTSLLKTILGVLKPLAGQILIQGTQINSLTLQERATKISLLESQNNVVFPMSVKELLEISLRVHGNEDIYKTALEALDLKNIENKNLMHLSSGEIKRAFLAHALCGNSKIILLDEPLAHLDWKHQWQLVETIKEWRKRFSTTFVLAIHELEWIPRIADSVTALGKNRILIQGDSKTVLTSREVSEVFAFHASIDENPIDGSQRLTIGKRGHEV